MQLEDISSNSIDFNGKCNIEDVPLYIRNVKATNKPEDMQMLNKFNSKMGIINPMIYNRTAAHHSWLDRLLSAACGFF